jgi:hypothetical protein
VCCPVNYGVVLEEKYSPFKHGRQEGDVPIKSKLDGKKYMYGQIDWVIKKVSCRRPFDGSLGSEGPGGRGFPMKCWRAASSP